MASGSRHPLRRFPVPEAGTHAGTAGSSATELPPIPDFQAAMGNPNAWWNLLQDQFKQAVGNALADHHASQPEVKPKAPAKATSRLQARPTIR